MYFRQQQQQHILLCLGLVLVTLLSIATTPTDATYQAPYVVTMSDGLAGLAMFGFQKNGYFDFNYQLHDNEVSNGTLLLVCTWDEYNNLDDDSYCHNIEHTLRYTVSYAFYQPDGKELSYEYLAFPITFLIFAIIWLVLTLLWCVNWVMNRKQNVRLHKLITLFPFSKLAMVTYFCGFYFYLQNYGAVGLGVYVFFWLFYIIFRIVAVVVLLTIATGWGILPGRYNNLYKSLCVIVLLLVIAIVLGAIFGRFFAFLQYIIYIPILIIIFIKSDQNIRIIRATLLDAQTSSQMQPIDQQQQQQQHAPNGAFSIEENEQQHQAPLPPPQSADNSVQPNSVEQARDKDKALKLSQLEKKLRMFTAFKWIMLGYLVSEIVIEFLKAAIYFVWLWTFLDLLIDLTIFVCIGLTFRLRKEKLYYEFVDEE
ncbi:hypothetical protein SAMD00019534_068350 [Acytostelium subglobosum LB1]|uniref:hypothetical protein n=1 Tax=Acytostelium subglobosum LB1 TaxID=1410327 RepID=UPI000644CE3B|nr:hypothetical protein SAMD00019534_068350 [Acytostelium subglobosum LB1]GAM23660.1 hypothetical protein SAMD00019534_068350 [Acytostelium subglobosum LB1]|eukprot:XP_012753401.1 hypothetical protein SAMD00019534_068350 [Acytostelium subglobosum LB1]